MPKCERCYHNMVCIGVVEWENEYVEKCMHFKDKDQIAELPCKPMPVIVEHSDAYCPFCGENISGYYGEHNAPDIIFCVYCGEWLDNTKSMTFEEAKAMMKE